MPHAGTVRYGDVVMRQQARTPTDMPEGRAKKEIIRQATVV